MAGVRSSRVRRLSVLTEADSMRTWASSLRFRVVLHGACDVPLGILEKDEMTDRDDRGPLHDDAAAVSAHPRRDLVDVVHRDRALVADHGFPGNELPPA